MSFSHIYRIPIPISVWSGEKTTAEPPKSFRLRWMMPTSGRLVCHSFSCWRTPRQMPSLTFPTQMESMVDKPVTSSGYCPTDNAKRPGRSEVETETFLRFSVQRPGFGLIWLHGSATDEILPVEDSSWSTARSQCQDVSTWSYATALKAVATLGDKSENIHVDSSLNKCLPLYGVGKHS